MLLSRLEGFAPALAEQLLAPGEPLFEYWGHEASWLPLELYPAMGFRRRRFRVHPWWGDLLGEHPETADAVLRRLQEEGPLRMADFGGSDHAEWWGYRESKKVLAALWSAGEVAVAERRSFHRVFDLAERVVPAGYRGRDLDENDGIDALVLRALDGHGWATAGTLAATFRLEAKEARSSIARLVESGEVVPCTLETPERAIAGYVRPRHLELAARLRRIRPRRDVGVLLSPFDPVLWDRARVLQLFAFEQVLEIYKPKHQRVYGYYVLPILAGDRLVGRVDLKAHRAEGRLEVKALRFEAGGESPSAEDRAAAASALERLAAALQLTLD